MQKYIDPLSDFGFKKLFGSEQSKDLLMSFLNDLLDLEYKIVDLKFENVERQGEYKKDRKSIFDVRCVDCNNTIFIVELQKIDQPYFRDRMFYYTSLVVSDLGIKGKDWDYSLPKVYAIGITDFNLFKLEDDYLHHGKILNTKNHKIIYDKYSMIFVEIKKFNKKSDELKSHLDKWLYFIKHLNHDTQIYDLFKDDPEIHKGLTLANLASLNRDEQLSYLASIDEENQRFAEIKSAEEKGIQKGIQKGELNKALETAKNLISLGVNINIVIQSTGLTLEQLKEHQMI